MSFTPNLEKIKSPFRSTQMLKYAPFLYKKPQVYALRCLLNDIAGREGPGVIAARSYVLFNLRQGKVAPQRG